MLEGCNLSHPGSIITNRSPAWKSNVWRKKIIWMTNRLGTIIHNGMIKTNGLRRCRLKVKKKGRDSLEIKHFGRC